MRGRRQKIAGLAAGVLLALLATKADAVDSSTNATSCAIAAGRDAQNNIQICNFGLTPEQLRAVTKAAVDGATGSLQEQIVAVSKKLGVTESAAQTLLRIVGEQPDVSDENLGEVLTKVATDYVHLKTQVAALDPNNSDARDLVAKAKAEIDAGHLERAHELLRRATAAQVAAARAARQLQEQAKATEDSEMLGAARSAGAEGALALTERSTTTRLRCSNKPPNTPQPRRSTNGPVTSIVGR